jgi:AcrR family transcriptional regulator
MNGRVVVVKRDKQRMPKRDESYMEEQRELLAQAALECMLEKGVYETTMRDICDRAGVSMGALYVHYKTRDDLVIAACALNPPRTHRPITNWSDYVAASRAFFMSLLESDQLRRRARLAIQFVAAHVMDKGNSPGLRQAYDSAYRYYEESLRAIHAAGEITLPLGLQQTAKLHHRLEVGVGYVLVADKDVDAVAEVEALAAGLAITAGHVGGPNAITTRSAPKSENAKSNLRVVEPPGKPKPRGKRAT